MKYQAYEKYKDSGVEWLGEIPEHWGTSKLRYMFSFDKGLTITKENLLDEGVPCVNYGEVHSKYGFEVDPVINPLKCVSEQYLSSSQSSLLFLGDFVFADTSEDIDGSGNFTQLTSNKAVFAGYHTIIVRPKNKKSSRFYAYLFDSQEFRTHIRHSVKGVKVFSVTQAILRRGNIWLPALEEQQKIANFLDHETAKIDTLIDKQQQLIKLLKEKRQAVISHAVTKGLNPNAPMRDSGVEWLGEVPEHWGVSSINYVLNAIGDVDHYMPQSVEKGIPYVMTGDLKELVSSINFEDCKQVSHKDYLKLSSKIRSSKGDVIMARYATIGTASYIDVDDDFLVSYSCVTIKPNLSKVIGLYLFYYFKSDAFLQGIQNQINTNTQGNVGVNDLKKVKVALPTLAEQSIIIEYLQSKISKLNSISDRSQAAIGLMQERRTALISAAVTGKIDVRHHASLPAGSADTLMGESNDQ
ncbi:restriction endonuclease subunit S [Methyloprofundus sedimenti]|uniref:Restriction endonuclease subunit S n=1 Tax=Methyloprofundus sedimenti TaxID=1420851 RepID=A0A1V8M8X3_9GAMM|nr:restriction endonuclease subunit S [Methyloprofundus sedimenti]OQK17957.1 restriction endonuclease subunit S [Methyloprofundus sedimenti]